MQNSATISGKKAFLFLFSYFKRNIVSVLLGLVVLIGVDSLQLLLPRVIQKTLDELGKRSFSESVVAKSALTILLAALSMFVLRFLWRLLIILPSRRIERDMRNDMFKHLLTLSSSYFNVTKTGNLMALMVNDLNSIRMASGMAIIGLVDALFLSIMSFFFMLAINTQLTVITIAPLPLIIAILIFFGKRTQRLHLKTQEAFDAISSHTQESFSGIRVIKGFSQERAEHCRFLGLCNTLIRRNVAMVKLWGILFPSISLLASLSLGLLLLVGGKLVIESKLSIGQFVSFSFYIQLFVWPMIAIGWVFNLFQRGIASTKRVLELLTTTSEISVITSKPGTLPTLQGAVTVNRLSFKYPQSDTPVLTDLSISIPAGGSLGIVGKPGSGKTTLISLLFHLYQIENGRIMFDQLDINQLPTNLLRSSIQYVPQDSFLFSDTIRENIAFGAQTKPSQEGIERVAQIASVHDDIMNFSKGYETVVGERGITLSGGQKQRIALARALLSDAPILVLDDALSSVDAATERIIRAHLISEVKRKTSIIIAHRISTVKLCNSIIVLSNGVITEQGTHDELIERDGFYSRVFRLQIEKEAV